MVSASMLSITAFRATLQKRASLVRTLGGSRCSVQHTNVGLHPKLQQLLHRVLRGLGLVADDREPASGARRACLPATPISSGARPRCRAEFDVTDRADLRDDEIVILLRAQIWTQRLISSVMWGMIWTVLPRYSPRRSLSMTLW